MFTHEHKTELTSIISRISKEIAGNCNKLPAPDGSDAWAFRNSELYHLCDFLRGFRPNHNSSALVL